MTARRLLPVLLSLAPACSGDTIPGVIHLDPRLENGRSPARFLAEGREDCVFRGYGQADFRRVPDPVEGGVSVTLTDADFAETGP